MNKSRKKYLSLQENILLFSNDFWIPDDDKLNYIDSHSWFSIKEIDSLNENKIYDADLEIEDIKELIKCDKIRICPNKKQKIILLNWMNAYIRMYNETIKIIKKRRIFKRRTIVSWKTLRTKYLKNIKNRIIKASKLKKYEFNVQINSHVLDGAIQDACSKLKSCISNLKNGHIKHFRLRYLKKSKKTKTLKIEKYFVNIEKNTFCSRIFKEPFVFKRMGKNKKNKFTLKEIKKDFTIHYNSKTEEFTLLNPIQIEPQILHENKETISLDPGIRKFQTGYSNNKCVIIGSNLMPKIKTYLNKIDHINSLNIAEKKRKKIEKKCYKKIENLVDDMHWKTINYLTNNYGNILIGNLSTKDIVNNNSKNNLNRNTKRIGLLMKLYQFKQRLQFKCKQRNIGYEEIDEAYTSKTCTNCGHLKRNLGKAEIYNCDVCKISLDRDFNGARNIFLKSINEE